LCPQSTIDVVAVDINKPQVGDFLANLVPVGPTNQVAKQTYFSGYCQSAGMYYVLGNDQKATTGSTLFTYNFKTNTTTGPIAVNVNNVSTVDMACTEGYLVVTADSKVSTVTPSGAVAAVAVLFTNNEWANSGAAAFGNGKLYVSVEDPLNEEQYIATVDMASKAVTLSPKIPFTHTDPWFETMMMEDDGESLLVLLGAHDGPAIGKLNPSTGAVTVVVAKSEFRGLYTLSDGLKRLCADFKNNNIYVGLAVADSAAPTVTIVQPANAKPVHYSSFNGNIAPSNWCPVW